MARQSFRFRMLLRLRESERQQRRSELAQALEAERLLREQLDAAGAELIAARRHARDAAGPGPVNVDELLEYQRYVLRLQAQRRGIEQRCEQVQQEIERRRLVLVEADKQVRMLEKLRDKQELAERIDALRLEQKVLDEIGTRAAADPRRRHSG